MKFLATVLFFALAAIAGLHAYWAYGGLWPASSEIDLVRTVIGAPDWTRMPPRRMTLAIAGLILVAGLVALMVGDVLSYGTRIPGAMFIARIAAAAVALVFLARGAAGYLITQEFWVRAEPFATNDHLIYSPLSVAIGVGFFILLFNSRSTERTVS